MAQSCTQLAPTSGHRRGKRLLEGPRTGGSMMPPKPSSTSFSRLSVLTPPDSFSCQHIGSIRNFAVLYRSVTAVMIALSISCADSGQPVRRTQFRVRVTRARARRTRCSRQSCPPSSRSAGHHTATLLAERESRECRRRQVGVKRAKVG